MSSILLGLGANLDEPIVRLAEAVDVIQAFMAIDEVSSIYRTEPVGLVDQPDFYNIACRGRSPLPPAELLERLMDVEAGMGRTRTVRNGPRLIDIDILAYGDLVLDTPGLTLPHPRLAEREFVLEPLREIASEWRHPVTGLDPDEMLRELTPRRRVEFAGPFPRSSRQS
jgi:2-amino-4-hydroxy-6-hydroxymethyldihydropteridine diphosphokinase